MIGKAPAEVIEDVVYTAPVAVKCRGSHVDSVLRRDRNHLAASSPYLLSNPGTQSAVTERLISPKTS